MRGLKTVFLNIVLSVAILIGLVNVGQAQCPSDGDTPVPIPGEGIGNYASNWSASPAPLIYNIPGTNCWVDITYCTRNIYDGVSGAVIEQQIFMTGVEFDPNISPGGCDALDPSDIINASVDALFTTATPPCFCPGSCDQVFSVIRNSCWWMTLASSGEMQFWILAPCGENYCAKHCYVCYDRFAQQNVVVPNSCTYTTFGDGSNACESAPAGTWQMGVCYSVSCPN